MSRLIETICVQNGEIRNLEFHQQRVNRSRWKLFGLNDELDLGEIIKSGFDSIQSSENRLLSTSHRLASIAVEAKCRIIYDEKIHSVEINPYQIRKINSVKLIENNEIEYLFKFEDRSAFKLMKDSVLEDEIIIVRKGQITDTSYSNLVFFDGENWITPTSFLLNGTMRQSLLQSGKIMEEEVNPKDLNRFFSFKLINAMMNLEESPELDISIIH